MFAFGQASSDAVQRIAALTGIGTMYDDPEPATNVKDLLTDVLHYCDTLRLDFDELAEQARLMRDDEVVRP